MMCFCQRTDPNLTVFYPVLSSFSLCDMTEEDLTQNPQFCNLLAILTEHVDQTGLTAPLKTELEKVQGTMFTFRSSVWVTVFCVLPTSAGNQKTLQSHKLNYYKSMFDFLRVDVCIIAVYLFPGWAEAAEPETSMASLWEPLQGATGDDPGPLCQEAT